MFSEVGHFFKSGFRTAGSPGSNWRRTINGPSFGCHSFLSAFAQLRAHFNFPMFVQFETEGVWMTVVLKGGSVWAKPRFNIVYIFSIVTGEGL